MPHLPFSCRTVTIVGTGLLGASLGLALKARTSVRTVIGVSRSKDGLRRAADSGAIDTVCDDLGAAAAESDCLVLCTPVGVMGTLMEQAGPHLPPHAVVTDVGSTKVQVVLDVCAAWPGHARFIGAHPMAGAEVKGAAHAREDLFDGATVVLTPHADADADAAGQVRHLWESVGGHIAEMAPAEHDTVVARSSHLPHLMATLLTDLVAPLDPAQRRVVGPGFMDTTRVAAGDPEMWRDICLTNADEILRLWPEVTTKLDRLRDFVEARDGEGLLDYFAHLRDVRRSFGDNSGRPTE